jgi:hypothetical protein
VDIERRVSLPLLTSGSKLVGVWASETSLPASRQVSVALLKLIIHHSTYGHAVCAARVGVARDLNVSPWQAKCGLVAGCDGPQISKK